MDCTSPTKRRSMSKARFGDLICWSARNDWASMTFGIVYGHNINNLPMVLAKPRHTGVARKTNASDNYLIIARLEAQHPSGVIDPQVNDALDWWYAVDIEALRN